MTRIFIAGDSWGCGEWSDGNVVHLGIEQYFTDKGYTVVNTSQGGSSNNASFERLFKAMYKTYMPGDIVLFIVTDPIRDLRPYTNLTDEVYDAQGINLLAKKLLLDFFQRLNSISIKIHIIGGVTNYVPEMLNSFPNLIPTVPSWTELLVGDKPLFEKYKGKFWLGSWSDWTVNSINMPLLKSKRIRIARRVVDEIWDIDQSQKEIWIDPIFYPDGSHPNREGHQILFDYLVTHLSL